jgi:DNA ligase-1
LISGLPNEAGVYNRTVSEVMSRDGGQAFFYTFDYMGAGEYYHRYRIMAKSVEMTPGAIPVPGDVMLTTQDVLDYEAKMVELGYEGIMLRHPDLPYKYGRATVKGGELLKLKRFADSEAVVVEVEELMHNDNAAFANELGYTARSSAQAGQRPGGVLGALVVDHPVFGQFKIGTGFTAAQREAMWQKRAALFGALVKFKYLDYGMLDKPRHPVFLGFRSEIDQ